MAEQTKVLYTGGSGDIGKAFARLADPKYKLRLTYNSHPIESDVHEIVQMDLTDMESVRAAMRGVDSVVHMAADSSPFAPWESILNNNLIGTYNVYEAARLEGVRRVVFGSSNWTCAFHIAEHDSVGSDSPVRPANFYGVSKCFGEALGSHYYDTYGLSIICLRIGCTHDPSDEGPTPEELVRLSKVAPEQKPYEGDVYLRLWVSNRDMTQLIEKSLETECGYGVFLACSDNQPAIYDLSETKRVLGYKPVHGIQQFWDFEKSCPRE
jgi:NAD+ dependent glucose-6-phosphate dehydrogenase